MQRMNTISVKDFQTHTKRVLSTLSKNRATALTGPDGAPAAYLVDVGVFAELQARVRLLEGIARGEQAIKEGRVLTQAEARQKMARWLKRK
jgi:hypothetical protein